MAMHRGLKNLASTKSAGVLEVISTVPGSKEETYWKGYQKGVKDAIEAMQKEILLVQQEEIKKITEVVRR